METLGTERKLLKQQCGCSSHKTFFRHYWQCFGCWQWCCCDVFGFLAMSSPADNIGNGRAAQRATHNNPWGLHNEHDDRPWTGRGLELASWLVDRDRCHTWRRNGRRTGGPEMRRRGLGRDQKRDDTRSETCLCARSTRNWNVRGIRCFVELDNPIF